MCKCVFCVNQNPNVLFELVASKTVEYLTFVVVVVDIDLSYSLPKKQISSDLKGSKNVQAEPSLLK